jgi:peptidoglycan/xylan/chitin deacetylase (PgdA/CDA1 family)
VWALTFDDGPHKELTPSVLQTLKSENVKATFFVVGYHLEESHGPALLQQAFREGHTIASHTYKHPDLKTLSDSKILEEMSKTDRLITKHIGVSPRYMRPPYGSIDQRVLSVLKNASYTPINWNIDSDDWRYADHHNGGDMVINNYKTRMAPFTTANSVISLAHDTQKWTAPTLRKVIQLIKNAGFKLVTMEQCLGSAYPAYRGSSGQPQTGPTPPSHGTIEPLITFSG